MSWLRRAELWLVLPLVIGLAIAVIAGGKREVYTNQWEPASTFKSGPNGGRAPYDVLARLGVPVERRRTAFFDLAREVRRRPAELAVVAPSFSVMPAEVDAVADYVRSGGRVVIGGDAGDLSRCFGWDITTASSDTSHALDSVAVRIPSPFQVLPHVWQVLMPLDTGKAGREQIKKATGEVKRRPRPTVRRFTESAARECATLAPSGVDTLLITVRGDPVILRLSYRGGGAALLIAEDNYLRNRAWRDTDVPYLLVPLLLPPPGQPGHVAWDEYHHGEGRDRSLIGAVTQWSAHAPAGWALWQLIGVGLIWLAVAAIRFGPAVPVIDVRRRSPVEHLEALAAGLEGAAGVETAVGLTVSGLRRRLSRTGQATSLRGDPSSWLAALELALPGARGRAAARRLRDILHSPGGSERVLGAAQAVEDVWEELRPRATPAAS